MTRVIAIANQKGGVGKSTTAVSLGAALADIGMRVLVIDLDPQGNASTGMGIRHEAREVTVYDVLASDAPIRDAVVPTAVSGLSAVPSTIDLAGAEIELVSQFSREAKLKKAIEPLRETNEYDFVILDCPPSLGLLTVNALTAAEELIVPIQCEYYALEGLGQLLRNVGLVQQNINPDLRLSGIVMTMFDPRTKLSEQVVEEVQRYFGDLVYDVIIPRTVRLSEAPGFGQPITIYDPKSKGAECYRRLAQEVARREPPAGPMPTYDDLPTVVVPAVAEAVKLAPEPTEDELESVPTVHELVEDEAAPEPAAAEAGPRSKAKPAVPERAAAKPAVPERAAAKPAGAVASDAAGDSSVAELDEDLWEPDQGDEPSESTPSPGSGRPPAKPQAGGPDPSDVADRPAPPPAGPNPRVVVIDEGSADYTGASRPTGPRPVPSTAAIGATLEEDGKKARRWRLFRKGGE